MKDLIKALTILLKYANDDRNPIYFKHDELHIGCGITRDMVSKQDLDELDQLGVFWSEIDESFMSFRFGSC